MALKINNEKYKTAPFKCWPLMKEIRREHFWDTWNSQKQGGFVTMGMGLANIGFLGGIGHVANPSIGPHFTRLARTPNAEGITQMVEVAEAEGFGRDVCGAIKAHLGQVFSGMSTTSPMGEHIRHDFGWDNTGCHAITKGTQIGSEAVGAPLLLIDTPTGKKRENARKYLLAQFQDAIEWLEKRTGKKYDDEKLIEGVKNEWETSILFAKCLEQLKAIPAPASMRDMFSLRLPLVTGRHKKRVVDYLQILLDELKDRVKNQISAYGFEKLRLTHENLHALYRISVLLSPEEYGAIFVNGVALDFGLWEWKEDGSCVPARSPAERGIEIRTREDALKSIIERMDMRQDDALERRGYYWYRRAKDWNIDAVVIHYDRPCQPEMINTLEGRTYLQEHGIPVGVYVSSQGDPRDFDERRILGPGGELPTFYESLGLTKLENVGRAHYTAADIET